MYHPLLDVFIAVAEEGSFQKAAEKLYMSSPTVMKKINQLEEYAGIRLLERTSRGTELTAAGKVFLEEAVRIRQIGKEALELVRKTDGAQQPILIRIGSSFLYPHYLITDLWEKQSQSHPEYRIEIIPDNDRHSGSMTDELGKNYDLTAGLYDPLIQNRSIGFMKLGESRIMLAMTKQHSLARKDEVSFEDLAGQKIMMVRRGYSVIQDSIRDELESRGNAAVIDLPVHYDISVFNRCQEENCLLLNSELWKTVHPMLVSRPLKTDAVMPYGILYHVPLRDSVKRFLDLLISES